MSEPTVEIAKELWDELEGTTPGGVVFGAVVSEGRDAVTVEVDVSGALAGRLLELTFGTVDGETELVRIQPVT